MSKKQSPLGEGIPLDLEAIQSQFRFLQGKVLTVIDASYPAGVQCKAVKDLVNQAFSDQMTYISQLCYPDIRMMTADEAESTIEDYEEIVRSAEPIS